MIYTVNQTSTHDCMCIVKASDTRQKPPASPTGWNGVDSVFKTQTRPVKFPLITLHSSQSNAAHYIFSFISAAPLRQRQEWVLNGGIRVAVRGGGGGSWASRLKSHLFCPQGCELLLLLFPFSSLCLRTD